MPTLPGTMAVISELETTVSVAAGMPLKVTLVAPVRLVPQIIFCITTL